MTKNDAIKAIEPIAHICRAAIAEGTKDQAYAWVIALDAINDAMAAVSALPDAGWRDISEVKEADGMVLCAGFWPNGSPWRSLGFADDGYAVGDWDEGLEPEFFTALPPPPEKA